MTTLTVDQDQSLISGQAAHGSRADEGSTVRNGLAAQIEAGNECSQYIVHIGKRDIAQFLGREYIYRYWGFTHSTGLTANTGNDHFFNDVGIFRSGLQWHESHRQRHNEGGEAKRAFLPQRSPALHRARYPLVGAELVVLFHKFLQ